MVSLLLCYRKELKGLRSDDSNSGFEENCLWSEETKFFLLFSKVGVPFFLSALKGLLQFPAKQEASVNYHHFHKDRDSGEVRILEIGVFLLPVNLPFVCQGGSIWSIREIVIWEQRGKAAWGRKPVGLHKSLSFHLLLLSPPSVRCDSSWKVVMLKSAWTRSAQSRAVL